MQYILFWQSSQIGVVRFRSSHQRCSLKKFVLRNFTKFTGKHLCQSLFIKKETLAQVFSSEFCEVSQNIFFTEHLWTTASVDWTDKHAPACDTQNSYSRNYNIDGGFFYQIKASTEPRETSKMDPFGKVLNTPLQSYNSKIWMFAEGWVHKWLSFNNFVTFLFLKTSQVLLHLYCHQVDLLNIWKK